MAEDKPSLIHKIFYISGLIFGADLGYRIGMNYGSFLLSIIFAVIGAIAVSTFVGFIAIKVFGYKP
jgi:hypothetical protein